MKKLLLSITGVFLLLINIDAQVLKPAKVNTNASKANIDIQVAAKQKAEEDKYINAKLIKIEFKIGGISYYIPGTAQAFYNRSFSIKTPDGSFEFKQKVEGNGDTKFYDPSKKQLYNETYTYTPNTSVTYKDFKNAGAMVNVDFTEHKGWNYASEFYITLYFDNGKMVPLDITGRYTAAMGAELHVSKSTQGDSFKLPIKNPSVPKVTY